MQTNFNIILQFSEKYPIVIVTIPILITTSNKIDRFVYHEYKGGEKLKYKYPFLISMLTLFAIIISGVLLWFYNVNFPLQKASVTKSINVKEISKSHYSLSYKSYTHSLHLAAIGDVLIHDRVYNDAKTNDHYDFKPMFAQVKSLLQQADITIANQESMAGGTELGLSSYPSFNSPHEIADALKDAGVDIISIANNHSIDRGEKGILSATNYYRKIDLPYEGAYSSVQDKELPRILTKNGIKVGFLAYTYGTNGIHVPDGKSFLVNLIDEGKMKMDIEHIKPLCDVVVVSMHWGIEYQRFPSDIQKELAVKIANDGADIIIGHHPHVLQPMEWITRKDGKKTFVAFSLGNFLSGQEHEFKDIGGILDIEIVKEIKDNKVNISLQNPLFTPTYVSSQHQHHYEVIPLTNAATAGLPNASAVNTEINKHMNQWLATAK
jgi:poly-gamma-glutamate capsule biosynthesis protein CapA/YwtB (metallophosphatase superfamily)